MPFAQFTGTGDSTTTQFQIPFPYVKKDHIIVSLNQVANTNFTYDNLNHCELLYDNEQ